jgi:tetratricopeptide (TPR) repeat protein
MSSRKRRRTGPLKRLMRHVTRFGLMVVLAAIVVVAAFYGGYRLLSKYRAGQMASGAQEYLAEGKVREALLRAQSALRLEPEGPEAWRSMAAVMESIGNPLALGCYEKLVTLGVATDEDRRNYVRAALRLGQSSMARSQAEVLKQSGDAGFVDFVAAEDAMRAGRLEAAEQALRKVPSSSAVHGEARLLLGQMLSAREESPARDEALVIFRELSQGDDRVAAAALAAGLTSGVAPEGERPAWADRLEKHPGGDEKTFLVVQSARLEEDPGLRPQVLDAVMTHFTGRGVERKTSAVIWLNSLQEYDLALRLVSSQEALSDTDAFVAWLDTLAGKGDWPRVESALAGEKIPLQGVSLEMFRARAARMTGKEGAARQGYQRAVNTALRQPQQIGAVMAFLENDGQLEVLRETFVAGLAEPATAEASKLGLLAVEKRSRDAAKMRDLLKKLRDALPEDNEVKSAAIYYDLVLGGRGLGSEAWQMREAEPDNFGRRAVHALAVLQEGFPEKAVRVFDGLSVRSDQITPEQKAIVVSVLAANGRLDQAQAMASTLDENDLTREEAAMVNGYLQAGASGAVGE